MIDGDNNCLLMLNKEAPEKDIQFVINKLRTIEGCSEKWGRKLKACCCTIGKSQLLHPVYYGLFLPVQTFKGSSFL
jgi:hypothetical protein